MHKGCICSMGDERICIVGHLLSPCRHEAYHCIGLVLMRSCVGNPSSYRGSQGVRSFL